MSQLAQVQAGSQRAVALQAQLSPHWQDGPQPQAASWGSPSWFAALWSVCWLVIEASSGWVSLGTPHT